MYAIKVLSGVNAGQTHNLIKGETFIGRSPQCEIAISNKNVSKKHAKIILDQDRILFTDLNSTNGSFVNGVKVEITLIKKGDKISLYDTLLEVVKSNDAPFQLKDNSFNTDSENENLELKYKPPVEQFLYKADKYLDKAAMPPLQMLSEKIDFKWIIGLLLFVSIVATALLSTIPLMSIIQDTVELESKQRASSLAKALAMSNVKPLQSGSFSGASVSLVYQEPGVKKAYIIRQHNGEIVSPSAFFGKFPSSSLIHKARKITERSSHVFKGRGNTIIAMHPVKFYSPSSGTELTKFYAVVVYNAQALSFGNEKTLSLFIQTLFLSLLVGFIIFYFLYKIVEYPFVRILRDLKAALQQGTHEELQTSILFNPLKELYLISSSLLNRSDEASSKSGFTTIEVDRSMEVQNLIEMLGYPSIIISGDTHTVLDYNSMFEDLTRLYDIKGIRVVELTDQALKQNLIDLVERSRVSPDEITLNSLEFSGISYEVRMHPVHGTNDIAYFVCSFFPMEESE